MERVIAADSVAFSNRDLAPSSGTPQYFTSGTPGIQAATVLPGWFLNMLQDELVAVETAAGIVTDKDNWHQLWQAILKVDYVIDSGAANALVATPASTADSLRDGMRVAVKVAANNTKASTL